MGRPEEAGETSGSEGESPRRSRFALQLAAAVAASHACAINCYAIGWGVTATWQLRQTDDAPPGELRLSDAERAWLNSVLYLGTAFGCLLGGRAAARFGPRLAMLYSLLPLGLSQAAVALANSSAVLLAARLLVGLTCGVPYGVYVLYISGTSSPQYRGALTIMADIACILAIIFGVALGEVLNWRWLAAICGIVSVVPTGGLLLLLPDDPVWLLSCGRLADAKRSAAAFGVDLELADTTTLDETPGGWRATLGLLTQRKNLMPLGIVMMLNLFSSFSGYMAILSYSLEFFRMAGFQLDAAVCSILFCAIRVLAVLLTSTLVDRLGRRVLLVFSCGGVSVCYMGLVAYYQLPALHHLTALPIVLLLAAGFVYSSALACLPFCLAGEIFPLRMRQLGGSLVTFSYCTFSMLATLAFPHTMAALGASGVFFTHGVLMAGACLFTLLAVPETKGLSLAAIETLFDRDASKEEDGPATGADYSKGGV
ncbi:facilitated trehalose transporter Tret1-like [Amphibalanus amphitrite]|uniref:facilitated trehalose transporter Tret1-like n=1 Tax=Amphibalanus amphitrite TaxID=1232801 RepID=UPI001C907EED|nr:facilitated trehalose transporter Tret1-like [Amphibalanus amphitrite]